MADWLSFAGSGVGAATNLVGSLIGNHQSSENVKRQIEAQREENRLNREFNAREAQLNRDFQSGQIASYRRYNSAVAQVARLQEAGFHPSAMLGNVQPQDSGLSSGAQASSNGGISPVGYSPLDLSATSRNIAEARMLESQARKNDADAHNSESQAITEDMARSGKIVLQGIEIDLGEWSKKMAPEEYNKLKGEVLSLEDAHNTAVKTVESLDAQIANVKQDTLSKWMDNVFASQSFQFRLRDMAARCHITETEAKYAVAQQIAALSNLKADTKSKLASAFQSTSLGKYFSNKQQLDTLEWNGFSGVRYQHAVLENKRMKFDLSQDEKWDDTERGMKVAEQSVGFAQLFFDDVMDYVDSGKDTLTHEEYIYGDDGKLNRKFTTNGKKNKPKVKPSRPKFSRLNRPH